MPNVKVVYESEGEIRRYSLPSGAGAFQELSSKIRGVLGPDAMFRIFWKDSEGDVVACDSDMELQGALDSIAVSGDSTDVLRLYVRITGRSHNQANLSTATQDSEMRETTKEAEKEGTPTGEPQGPKAHVGVSCDGCDGEVVGIRYKCTKCDDYDLCEICKGKGYHAEHVMDSIAEPADRADGGEEEAEFIFPWMRHAGGGCFRGRRHGHKHGHPHGHHHGHGGHHFPGRKHMGHHGFGGMFQSMGEGFQSMGQGFQAMGEGFQSQHMPTFPFGGCRATQNDSNQPKSVDEIAKALKDMGIQADGGVIRELIEQFHGDITKIIEAMN